MNNRESPLLAWLVSHLTFDHGILPDRLEGHPIQYLDGFHDGRHVVGELHDHTAYELAKDAQREWLMEQIDIPIRQSDKEAG